MAVGRPLPSITIFASDAKLKKAIELKVSDL